MKRKFLLLLTILIGGISLVNAQGGQRQTPEERTKATMEKLSTLNLDGETTKKTEAIFSDYNNTWQKEMEEMRASGSDREAMMAKRKELSEARDTKLKAIFSADQMKKWKEEIEPSMRPQRGNAPPTNN